MTKSFQILGQIKLQAIVAILIITPMLSTWFNSAKIIIFECWLTWFGVYKNFLYITVQKGNLIQNQKNFAEAEEFCVNMISSYNVKLMTSKYQILQISL